MPLSQAAPRRKLHTRRIVIDGYEREDGNFDVEAHLTDTKTYEFDNEHRGRVRPGQPLHDMRVRLTFDDRMTILAAEAVTDTGPYDACPAAAASYGHLVGLRIRAGFLREANARMAGPAGCTHLREMLQEIATTALQTVWAIRAERAAAARAAAGQPAPADDGSSRQINTCLAYAADGEVVKQRWPDHYTGPVMPRREAELAAQAERVPQGERVPQAGAAARG